MPVFVRNGEHAISLFWFYHFFLFKTEFPISITRFYEATPWLRVMTGITATKE